MPPALLSPPATIGISRMELWIQVCSWCADHCVKSATEPLHQELTLNRVGAVKDATRRALHPRPVRLLSNAGSFNACQAQTRTIAGGPPFTFPPTHQCWHMTTRVYIAAKSVLGVPTGRVQFVALLSTGDWVYRSRKNLEISLLATMLRRAMRGE